MSLVFGSPNNGEPPISQIMLNRTTYDLRKAHNMTVKKNNRLLKLFLGVITINFVACVAAPFTRHKTPDISGTILSNNIAAEGVQLYLSTTGGDKHCSRYTSQTLTNDQGRFSFTSIRENMDSTPLMTHYFDEWTLCVGIAGTRQAIYTNNRYGQGSVIAAVHLNCELNKINRKGSACHQPLLKN
jgi:hypothetical protein